MGYRRPLLWDTFTGLYTALDGLGPHGSASDMLNSRVQDGTVKFRYGFAMRRDRPTLFQQCFGFQFVRSFTATTSVGELISIEKRNGVVKPYSTIAGTETEIKNGTVSLSLDQKEAFIVNFFGTAYTLQPGATKTLWKHTIGDATSWTALQDTSYAPPPSDPTLTLTANPISTRGNDATDTFTISLLPGTTAGINGGITATAASGILTVQANSFNRVGNQRTQIQSVFASTVDWSSSDYIAFKAQAGQIYVSFERTSIAPQIYDGAAWHTIPGTDFKEYFSATNHETTIVVDMKSLGFRNAVKGFRILIGGPTEDLLTGTQTAFTVSPVELGGTYLESLNSSHRLWDGNLDGDGITYGVRYKNTVGPAYSAVIQGTITKEVSQGNFPISAPYACPLGAKLVLSTPVGTGGWTNVEFLRLMQDGVTWKIIGTVANTGAPQFQDPYEENQLSGLTTAPSVGVTPITPIPPFTATGLLSHCRYKGFMCWCFQGTSGNIRYSRVLTERFPNAAEELYDSQITYDAGDTTAPANYTLSEGGDEAIGVCADDDVLYFLGRMGVYVQAGAYPTAMSPTVKVPNSSPCAGVRAFCIFPPLDARAGLVYLDYQGVLWFVHASRSGISSVISSEPIELSAEIRGTIKTFLLDEQRNAYGFTDLSTARVFYSQHDSSLRISMGDREIIYRPRNLKTGKRFFEKHEWTLRRSVSSITTLCTDFTGGVSSPGSVTRSGSTVAWSNTSNALVQDGNYATSSPIGPNDKTELLRNGQISLPTVIPLGATPTKVSLKLIQMASGDIPMTMDEFYLLVGNSRVGSNHATGTQPASTPETIQVDLTSALPSLTDLNAGNVGFEVGYLAAVFSNNALIGTNYTITVIGATSSTMTVNVTYIGGGTPPPFMFLNLNSQVHVTMIAGGGPTPSLPWSGTGAADDGLGDTAAGALYIAGASPDPVHDSYVDVAGSKRVKVVLTAGVGSTTVVRSGTGTVNQSGTVISPTYNGSAAFSPFVLSTVSVDVEEMSACYSEPTVSDPGPTSIQGYTTIDNGSTYWIRSSGEIDEVEWDSTRNAWIEGTNRDGGQAPKNAYYQLGKFRHAFNTISRLRTLSVEVGEYGDTVAFSLYLDERKTPVLGTRSGRTSYGFPITAQGHSVEIRFTFDESFGSMNAIRPGFTALSNQRLR